MIILKSDVIRTSVLAASFLGLVTVAGAQSALAPPQKVLPPSELHKLLREPNGLAAAATLVGHLELSDDDEPRGSTLSSMLTESSLVVEGTIAGSDARLTEDGDNLATDYVMQLSHVFKGKVGGGVVTFSARGGTIVFPNGTSAHVENVASDNIKTDRDYIVFLKPEEARNILVSGSASVVSTSSQTNSVSALDPKDFNCEFTRKSLGKMSLSDLEAYLRDPVNNDHH